jgi:hypothetical protein
MSTHPSRIVGLAAALLLTAAGAQAQGHGHGNDKDHGKGHGRQEQQDLRPDDRGDGRGIHQGGVDQRDVYDNGGRRVPPGLAKKPGGMPPGQYKKQYTTQQGSSVLRDILVNRGYNVVRTQNAGQSQYVYYRTRDGALRRAIVSPGTDQLAFSNVPASLLREVLSRLY